MNMLEQTIRIYVAQQMYSDGSSEEYVFTSEYKVQINYLANLTAWETKKKNIKFTLK